MGCGDQLHAALCNCAARQCLCFCSNLKFKALLLSICHEGAWKTISIQAYLFVVPGSCRAIKEVEIQISAVNFHGV